MPFITLGINHQTAPVEVRERLAFDASQLPGALAELRALDGVDEMVLLSTCNRTELYCAASHDVSAAVLDWLIAHRAPGDEALRERLYRFDDAAAIGHLMRVACGLDSMVLGEPQVLGQLKQAYETATAAGCVGPELHRLFQQCFAVAKQVRTDTSIGSNPVSVASAAVSLARQIFGDLRPRTALLIGAGETIELAARHLDGQGMTRIVIANRTLSRAEELAHSLKAYAIPLTDLERHLPEADIVISSTASPTPILTRAMVSAALAPRRHRPMCIVDLAVPRDVEPAVGTLADVYLYGIDDLDSVIAENRRARAAAAEDAERIIASEIARFTQQRRGRDAGPVIQALRAQADGEAARALDQARRELAAGRPADEVLARLAELLAHRLVHRPSAALRSGDDPRLVEAVRRLFDLP